MTKEELKNRVLLALQAAKGDDLCRARAAFGRLSEAELDQQYGESGKTRRQILEEYEAHEREINETAEWVKSL